MDPITIAAIIGGCLGLIGMGSAWGQQGYSQYHATQLQDDAQKFNAKQAELNREWQEEMYEKYNSLSGKIAQAKEAGVNPLFAVTGNSVMPAPSTATPASSGINVPGAAPSSVSAVTQLMDVLSNVKLKDAQAENIKSATENERNESIAEVALKNAKSSEALASASEISTRTQHSIESWNKELKKLDEEIAAIKANKALSEKQKEVEIQKKAYFEAMASYQQWRSDNASLHYWIDTGFRALGAVTDIGDLIVKLKRGFGLPVNDEEKGLRLPDPEKPGQVQHPAPKLEKHGSVSPEEFVDILDYMFFE